MTTPVRLTELIDAFQWARAGGGVENEAHLDLQSGRFWLIGDWEDEEDPAPGNLGDASLYLQVPSQSELGLGRHLALRFAQEQAPQLEEQVRRCFEKKGAYGRFKNLLDDHGLLQAWYDFEAAAIEQALREWAAENGLDLVAGSTDAPP